jgi:hypothetical protein
MQKLPITGEKLDNDHRLNQLSASQEARKMTESPRGSR